MPTALASLAPLLGPILQEAFDQIVYPQIVAEAAKVSSPDVQVFVQSLLPALKVAIDQEIAKLSK